jgi:cell division protein FtsW (lipid II flippase)
VNALWSWLTTPPTYESVLDPFAALYLAVFSIGFVFSAYASGPGANRFDHDARFEGMQRWATAGIGVFGAGLFFFAVRALQINPLSFGAPIWMLASVIALAIFAVRFAIWWKTAASLRMVHRRHSARIGHIGAGTDAVHDVNTG